MLVVLVGTPAEVHDPRSLIQNLVFVMKLLDCEVHSLLMFLDVDMLISKQLALDKSGTRCPLRRQLIASNVLYMHNETRVHIST